MVRRFRVPWWLVAGVICWLAAIAVTLFLITFDLRDPSWLVDQAGTMMPSSHVWGGWLGAALAATFIFLFGSAAFLVVPVLGALGLIFAQKERGCVTVRYLVGTLLLLVTGAVWAETYGAWSFYAWRGGIVGAFLASSMKSLTDAFIAPVIWYGVALCSVVFMVPTGLMRWSAEKFHQGRVAVVQLIPGLLSKVGWLSKVARRLKEYGAARTSSGSADEKTEDPLEVLVREIVRADSQSVAPDQSSDQDFWKLLSEKSFEPAQLESGPIFDGGSETESAGPDRTNHSTVFVLPPVTLFRDHAPEHDGAEAHNQAEKTAKSLLAKLAQMGVVGTIEAMHIGPVVTLFEFAPSAETKISKITLLEDDLALALGALSLRIIAPIPGKTVVGFEVANAQRVPVYFSSMIRSESFTKTKALLPIVLGKGTDGGDVVVDLAAMPHLLVAGSTGSGKSVALNTMLASILCSRAPDQVRLVLVDPKRLEFALYADSPYLLFPVVTEVARAAGVLKWLVTTMEHRYEELARNGVKTITEYHKKRGMAAMPFIVVMIDELADIMMTTGKIVEPYIARIAQMARAAGIHLIIATQRPSVDVLTGFVKVNFPARIAFKVASRIDSRTILDASGAERLLGRGDMLFLNPRGGLDRVHGAYLTDEEIEALILHGKRQRQPIYETLEEAHAEGGSNLVDDDPLFDEIKKFVLSVDEISISLLQRRFRIGFNRSARLIDLLEARGIIAPSSGGKMRKVVHTEHSA